MDGRVRSATKSDSIKQSNSRPSSSSAPTYNNTVINDQVLSRFIEIQAQIEDYERQGVFDGLRLVEEDFERLEKSKRQAEINHKVLEEQTKKEKQDFENISQPTVQSFFRNKQAHNIAISKEQVSSSLPTIIYFILFIWFIRFKQEYLNSLNSLEIATNELKAITSQYEHAKDRLGRYKRENQKAIELYNEQMNLLCNLLSV